VNLVISKSGSGMSHDVCSPSTFVELLLKIDCWIKNKLVG